MRPRGLGVNKRITKTCPECQKQTPTACKTCKCGFVFFRRNTPPSPAPPAFADTMTRRTTGRVKREPNYFNTMEYEQHFKRKRRTVSSSEEVGKKRRGRYKTKSVSLSVPPKPPKEEPKIYTEVQSQASSSCDTPQQKEKEERVQEEDLYGGLSKEKGLQYSIILAEINNKFLGQTFNPT